MCNFENASYLGAMASDCDCFQRVLPSKRIAPKEDLGCLSGGMDLEAHGLNRFGPNTKLLQLGPHCMV